MSTSEALLLKGHEKSFRSIKHGLVQATVVALKDDDLSVCILVKLSSGANLNLVNIC